MSQNGTQSGRPWQSGQGAKEQWQLESQHRVRVGHEESLIERLTERLKRATETNHRNRLGVRIKKANARLIALKLTAP